MKSNYDYLTPGEQAEFDRLETAVRGHKLAIADLKPRMNALLKNGSRRMQQARHQR